MQKVAYRYKNFKSILKDLEEELYKTKLSKLEKAGVIQYFEITFELSWKMLKDYLFYLGFDMKSPREVFKKSYELGLIDEIDKFLSMLGDRNSTTHIYDEMLVSEIFEKIKFDYFYLFKDLERKIDEIISKRY